MISTQPYTVWWIQRIKPYTTNTISACIMRGASSSCMDFTVCDISVTESSVDITHGCIQNIWVVEILPELEIGKHLIYEASKAFARSLNKLHRQQHVVMLTRSDNLRQHLVMVEIYKGIICKLSIWVVSHLQTLSVRAQCCCPCHAWFCNFWEDVLAFMWAVSHPKW